MDKQIDNNIEIAVSSCSKCPFYNKKEVVYKKSGNELDLQLDLTCNLQSFGNGEYCCWRSGKNGIDEYNKIIDIDRSIEREVHENCKLKKAKAVIIPTKNPIGINIINKKDYLFTPMECGQCPMFLIMYDGSRSYAKCSIGSFDLRFSDVSKKIPGQKQDHDEKCENMAEEISLGLSGNCMLKNASATVMLDLKETSKCV